jgi:hypothetical protein
MAKLLAIVFVVVATVSCGSTRAATAPLATPASFAPSLLSFHAAPIEGSPEQAAIELGRGVGFTTYDDVPGDAGK